MDNIQKLILGVLGISGMLAMLVPSGVSMAPPSPTVATVPSANADIIAPVATDEEAIPEEEITEESEMTDEDVFVTGEPAIDGNPLGNQSQGNQPNYDAPQPVGGQFVPNQSFDYSQPIMPTTYNYAQPQTLIAPAPPAN